MLKHSQYYVTFFLTCQTLLQIDNVQNNRAWTTDEVGVVTTCACAYKQLIQYYIYL